MEVNFKNKLKLVVNSTIHQKDDLSNKNSSISLDEDTYTQILNAYTNRLMARRLKPSSIKTTINTINDLFLFTNQYPWGWTAEAFDEWCAYLYRERNNCEATQRHKQNMIADFSPF